MPLKTIVVHVDAGPSAGERVDLALALATEHGALLAGVHSRDLNPLILYAEASPTLIEQQQQWFEEDLRRARDLFQDRSSRMSVPTTWLELQGPAVRSVALTASAADLLVMSTSGSGDSALAASSLAEDLIFAAGRPLLVTPPTASRHPFRSILIAWNGSREAARALHDALPLLERAERVTVAAFDPNDQVARIAPPSAVCDHLRRHGIEAEPAIVATDGGDAGSAVLGHAGSVGADLLVMGGYGHSRLRETILGGVTRTVLRETAIPVLISH